MQEIFYEESATLVNPRPEAAKYNTLKVLSIASYVLLGIWIFLALMYPLSSNILLDAIFLLVPAILFFVSGIMFGKFKNRFYVEYDYTFVSGSIRFSKVIKNYKRRFIIKFESSDVEKIGRVGSDTFERYYTMPAIDKVLLTSNSEAAEGKDFYYIVANTEEAKHIFILECTQTFLVNILRMTNRTVLEEGFKK